MRPNPKASSVGSSTRQTGRLGRIFRAALATRGAFSDASGSRAPFSRRTPLAFLAALTLALTVALGAATAIADAPPKATINTPGPGEVKFASAHLSGTVDPEGGPSPTLWHFEYRESSLAEEEANWIVFGGDQEIGAPVSEESNPVGVEENLTGLKPGTEYSVRLVATNEGGAHKAISTVKTLTTEAVAKPTATGLSVPAFTATTAHFEGTVASGGPGAGEETGTYRFECEPGCGGLEGEAPIETGPGDAGSHVVSADATALQPNTSYKVKLIARNVQTDAEGAAVIAQVEFTTSAIAPTAWAGTNTPESDTEVLLRGAVNPLNSPLTDCHFAYGPTTAYGHSAPCESEGPIEGHKPVNVTTKLSGLQPGIAWHFKVFATSTGGIGQSLDSPFVTFRAPEPENECPNEARREEQHATFLPECRAWEMVSPPDKNGGDVMADTGRTRADINGEAAEFSSLQAFGDAKGTGVATEYIARRNNTVPATQGWATHSIYPLREPNSFHGLFGGQDALYQGEFSPDLSKGVFVSPTPLSADHDTANVVNLYLREDLLAPGANSSQLLSACPLCVESEEPLREALTTEGIPKVADATPNFGKIIFESLKVLTKDARPQSFFCVLYGFGCSPRLYESDHGTLRFVGLIPPTGQTECDDSSAVHCTAAEIAFAGVGAFERLYTLNTLSTDGSKVFFTVPPDESSSSGDLYMRLDHATTVQLNASEKTEPDSSQAAKFQAASTDGSRVFFTSSEQLTDEPCGGLYFYDTTLPASDPHNLTCIFHDEQPVDGVEEATGVLGVSSDGSYVYFAVHSAILPDQSEPPNGALYGIYAWHNGTISFAGSVDNPSPAQLGTPWGGVRLQSRVTPDGRSLLFASHSGAGLTGHDHGDTCGELAGSAEPCNEFYLYKADTNSLTCVSCNPTGAATSSANFSEREGTGSAQTSSHLNHPITEDGRHIFFDTAERLVSEDTNGRRDVYGYDTQTAKLYLISSGTGSSDSFFLEATPDGSNVFFSTNQRLLGWDIDGSSDLYDARANGGFPEPSPTPAPCQGDGCRTRSAPPAATTANSQSFSGSERQAPRRLCPRRGKVRKYGKCAGNGHGKKHKQHTKAHRYANTNRGAGK